ncbi:hypothetical protein C5167_002154 [Papaver somniferum]|uniref:Uncharacterized protein n=1 Tax=Papaver somniferum TaxID=3469 RepID=A0A4Y7L0R7_PAPSO|nr:hypothetical protein C5167_002154 [Papaver somniferum]
MEKNGSGDCRWLWRMLVVVLLLIWRYYD